MTKPNLPSVVVPFVGTLNDDDAASPVIYNKNGTEKVVLEETPEIKMRKTRTRHYLRSLQCRFLRGEPLMLTAFFLTRNDRNIECRTLRTDAGTRNR